MSLRDCIVVARDGGEMEADEADRLLRRFDELSARGLAPDAIKTQMVAEEDGRAVRSGVRAFNAFRGQGQPPAAARKQTLDGFAAQGMSRTNIDRIAAAIDARERPKAEARDMALDLADDAGMLGDRGMRLAAREAILLGETVDIRPDLRTAVNRAVGEVADIVPEGYRVGTLERLAPIEQIARRSGDDPEVRATFRTPDGQKFGLDGRFSEFAGAGAIHDRAERVIALTIFGRSLFAGGDDAVGDLVKGVRSELGGDAPRAPSTGVAFGRDIRARVFHETVHAIWPTLDADSRIALVSHAVDRLGVLDMKYQEFSERVQFEPRRPTGDARDEITIRQAYEEIGASAAKINEEAAAHMLQLASVGALKSADLAPIRSILERYFNGRSGHMTRLLDLDEAAALAGWPSNPAVARAEFDRAVQSGRQAQVPTLIVQAGHAALRPHLHLVPEGVKVGFLKSVQPIADDPSVVRATFVTHDGKILNLSGSWRRYKNNRAMYAPQQNAILLFNFGGIGVDADARVIGGGVEPLRPDLGGRQTELERNLRDTLLGQLVHELVHVYVRFGIIDDDAFALLLSHGRKLRLLHMEVDTYLKLIGRPEDATVGPGNRLGDMYMRIYRGYSNPGMAIGEEYIAHLVERAWHGGFTAKELEPVREILEELFAGAKDTMARRLREFDREPRFAVGGGRESDEPDGAFHEAMPEGAADTAWRAHLTELTVARGEQRRVHSRKIASADLNEKTFLDIARLERKLIDDGKTMAEVAAALEAKFRVPFDPEDVGRREVWWRVEEGARGRGLKLGPNQERAYAEFYRATPDAEARLAHLREMLGAPVSHYVMLRHERELAERGLIERHPRARGGRPQKFTLTMEQEKAFAEAYRATPSPEARLERLRSIVGDTSVGEYTMARIQRELAEQGLIDARARGGWHEAHNRIATTAEQEQGLARIWTEGLANNRTKGWMLTEAEALLDRPISNGTFMRRVRELAKTGKVEMRTAGEAARMRSLADLTGEDIADLTASGAAEMRPQGGRERSIKLTPDQERKFAELYRTIPSEALRLERLREMTGGAGSIDSMRRLQRELADRGILDLRPKGGTTSKMRLTPDQEREFAEVYASGIPRTERLKVFREISGKPTAASSTMWVVERDLAQRGLIVQRAPAAARPRPDEPRAALVGGAEEERFADRQRATAEWLARYARDAEIERAYFERIMNAPHPVTEEIGASIIRRQVVKVLEACRS